MRRQALLWSALFLGGCGYVGYPLPPAANIPLPITNLKAAQVGDKMVVEFTQPLLTTEGLTIKRLGGLDVRVGEKIDPFSAGVWQEKAKPVPAELSESGEVSVAFNVKDWVGHDVIIGVRTTNVKGKTSTWSNFATVHVAAPPATPAELRADSDPKGIKLMWTGSSPSYRVFRRLPTEKEGAQIGEPTEASYVDATAEYDKKYVYWVVAVDGGAKSPESTTLEFMAKDTFAPAPPTGVAAIIGPTSIELAWESNIEPDLRGYRVYRSVAGAPPEQLAEVASPAFSDKKPVAGKKHSYTITAVDKHDNESGRNPRPSKWTSRSSRGGACYPEYLGTHFLPPLLGARTRQLGGVAAVLIALTSFSPLLRSQDLMTILNEEMKRNFEALKQKADPPPYFISYEVTDEESESMTATLGALASRQQNVARVLDVGVRVGSYEFDSSRRLNGDGLAHTTASTLLPYDGEPNGIRQRIWLETDHSYRAAAQRLNHIKTSQQVRAQSSGSETADFSKEEPQTFSGPPVSLKFAGDEWANHLRKVSAGFAPYPQILSSTLGLSAGRVTKYLVTTEGTSVSQSSRMYRVMLIARAKAFDGMDLAVTESWDAEDASKLPAEEQLLAAVDKAGKDLTALLRAPVVDPFVGPAILSGRAAGVFFHEIFGHRIEGHRQKDDSEGQTFSKSVGLPILPEFLSVDFDPTLKSMNGVDLNGSYLYDDEGIKARPLDARRERGLENLSHVAHSGERLRQIERPWTPAAGQ